ncbi:MAG: DNA replication/repair protein RecF [Acidimicrobiia bacterium]
MHLAWLKLRNFRSYSSLRFDPDPGVNVLVGDNGAGKTSLLEAVGYLGSARSFRGVPDGALISDGAASAIVRGSFEGGASETTVECEIPQEGRRTVLVNGKRPQRMRDLLSIVPVVAFIPDDLDLVKGGSAVRRDFLDDLAARIWPQAAAAQADYDRALRQRNSLLKQEGRGTDLVTLSVWDERLGVAAAGVLHHRRAVAAALQPQLAAAYRSVGGVGDLAWSYRSTWNSDAARDEEALKSALVDALERRRSKELEIRTTTAGPHRDEPDVLLDGRSTRTQASQGEQRTTALAMRVGAYRVIEQLRNQKPILLLDDVFSELDASRASRVLELIPVGQVFVTTARDDEVPIGGRRWSVNDGKVQP